ncbi:MAG: hypothetical protein HDR52_07205 [Treponema sp.]|nr:hypothetical protein [Treponema sp.]
MKEKYAITAELLPTLHYKLKRLKSKEKKIEKNILPVAVRNKNEKKSTFRPVHSTPFIISWNLIK